MRTKKLKTSKTAMLLSVCAAVALCINFVGACSADEDDIYYGDELKTRAKATRSESPESQGTGDSFWDSLKSQCGITGCGIWCVGYLMSGRTEPDINKLIGYANQLKSNWKTTGVDASFIISLSQLEQVNLHSNISSHYKVGEEEKNDQSRVAAKIRELNASGTFQNKIISVGTNHWYVAKKLNGESITCIDANSYPSTTTHPISSVTELVY